MSKNSVNVTQNVSINHTCGVGGGSGGGGIDIVSLLKIGAVLGVAAGVYTLFAQIVAALIALLIAMFLAVAATVAIVIYMARRMNRPVYRPVPPVVAGKVTEVKAADRSALESRLHAAEVTAQAALMAVQALTGRVPLPDRAPVVRPDSADGTPRHG